MSALVVGFRDDDGSIPLLAWLDRLPQKAVAKCIAAIELLKERGHELRRPHADYLRDGIYELRVKHTGINYRILYFFHGRTAVVLSHGITKQRATVPPREIEIAIARKERFAEAPAAHTYEV